MKVLGVTGGIASGKSTVVKILKNFGANVIDVDKIAHDLAEIDKPLWKAYTLHFGNDILLDDNNLNRKEIARRVFNEKKEREWIDNTSHPMIKAEVLSEVERLRKSGETQIVLDVPLLYEANWQNMVDAVLVVYVSKDTQINRLIKRDGIDRNSAEARLNAQMPLDNKKDLADFVINNECTFLELEKEVKKIWSEFLGQKN